MAVIFNFIFAFPCFFLFICSRFCWKLKWLFSKIPEWISLDCQNPLDLRSHPCGQFLFRCLLFLLAWKSFIFLCWTISFPSSKYFQCFDLPYLSVCWQLHSLLYIIAGLRPPVFEPGYTACTHGFLFLMYQTTSLDTNWKHLNLFFMKSTRHILEPQVLHFQTNCNIVSQRWLKTVFIQDTLFSWSEYYASCWNSNHETEPLELFDFYFSHRRFV